MKQRYLFALLGLGLSACAPVEEEIPPVVTKTDTGDIGGGAGGGDDPGDVPCSGEVELGRCEVTASGDDCPSIASEHVFVRLNECDPMTMVLGPQGAMMFVFAARTAEIDPSGPLIEINVLDSTSDIVARYRAHADFGPDPVEPTLSAVAGLFVVVDVPAQELAEKKLKAEVRVEDKQGVVHCGSATIVAAY